MSESERQMTGQSSTLHATPFSGDLAALSGFGAGLVVGGNMAITAATVFSTSGWIAPEQPFLAALFVFALGVALVGGCSWFFYRLFLRFAVVA